MGQFSDLGTFPPEDLTAKDLNTGVIKHRAGRTWSGILIPENRLQRLEPYTATVCWFISYPYMTALFGARGGDILRKTKHIRQPYSSTQPVHRPHACDCGGVVGQSCPDEKRSHHSPSRLIHNVNSHRLWSMHWTTWRNDSILKDTLEDWNWSDWCRRCWRIKTVTSCWCAAPKW